MFHELVHIIRGPHDAEFYKILDELFNEHETLLDSGFNPDGNKLGGSNIKAGKHKEKALESAKKRSWLNSIMPSGGIKLGGNNKNVEKDVGKLAAEAAEKRSRDSIWCGSLEDSSDNLPKRDFDKLNETHKSLKLESATNIDKSDLKSKSKISHVKNAVVTIQPTKFIDLTCDSDPILIISDEENNSENNNNLYISCPSCTLINEPGSKKCNLCSTIF